MYMHVCTSMYERSSVSFRNRWAVSAMVTSFIVAVTSVLQINGWTTWCCISYSTVAYCSYGGRSVGLVYGGSYEWNFVFQFTRC